MFNDMLTLIYSVYIFIMVLISFLLMFNTIINIILYNYYKYKFKNDELKKLYVYETYTYKIFISTLKDNLENYNNKYFTLNTSNDLLNIFIIFSIVFFCLLGLSDIFLIIKTMDTTKEINYELLFLTILLIVIYIIIFSTMISHTNYMSILIAFIVLWLFISLTAFLYANNSREKCTILSILAINPFLNIFIFSIFVILFTCFIIFNGFYENLNKKISYEKYCFETNIEDYNSIENYLYNEFLKSLNKDDLDKLSKILEHHNINTINIIVNTEAYIELTPTCEKSKNIQDKEKKKKEFLDLIIYISTELVNAKLIDDKIDDKYDNLDFVKLVNIFICNIIYKYGGESKNNFLKDLSFLFNNNVEVYTYNIDNVLIAAFPIDMLQENKYIQIVKKIDDKAKVSTDNGEGESVCTAAAEKKKKKEVKVPRDNSPAARTAAKARAAAKEREDKEMMAFMQAVATSWAENAKEKGKEADLPGLYAAEAKRRENEAKKVDGEIVDDNEKKAIKFWRDLANKRQGPVNQGPVNQGGGPNV